MDFDDQKALDYLLDIAYMRNISKVQLCEGICDASNFSKICSGKRKITLSLLLQLAFKLNISFDDLKLHASFENPDEYLSLLEQFQRLRSNSNFKEIQKLYQTYYETYSNFNLEAQQLFLWIKGIVETYIYLNPLHAIDILKNAIFISKPDFSFEVLNLELLNEKEFVILYDLLGGYMGHEEMTLHPNYQLDYPIKVCLAVIEELLQRRILKDKTLFPSFCSLLATIYGVHDQPSLVYLYTMKGLDYCQRHLECTAIPDFYIQLVVYERLLGHEEEALKYFYEALYLYRLQNRPPTFYRALNYFIKNQQLNVDLDKVNQLLPKPLLTTKIH